MGLAATIGLAATTGHAQDEESSERAVIPFANLGGIDDWRPAGHDAILIQARDQTWYRATFFAPCLGIQFAETIAFVTEPGGELDRFSSVIVDGDRCWIRTFEEVDAPQPEADQTDG